MGSTRPRRTPLRIPYEITRRKVILTVSGQTQWLPLDPSKLRQQLKTLVGGLDTGIHCNYFSLRAAMILVIFGDAFVNIHGCRRGRPGDEGYVVVVVTTTISSIVILIVIWPWTLKERVIRDDNFRTEEKQGDWVPLRSRPAQASGWRSTGLWCLPTWRWLVARATRDTS